MNLLESASSLLGSKVERVEKLHGDGSARRFHRVHAEGGRTLILLESADGRENAAWLRVQAHLSQRGVRVPQVVGSDLAAGLILMEDLGDENLYKRLSRLKSDAERFEEYKSVLALLVKMQVEGARDFTLETGFADAPYGPALMVDWEGLYFAREFACGVLGIQADEGALAGELDALASLAMEGGGGYFLHRDFQSRNLQRAPDGWAIIDFQGARPGPLAYDAAALICDPYAANSPALRARLWAEYFVILGASGVDEEPVKLPAPYLTAFRLMQALGAFGKLGGRLGKPGFLEHSGAALSMLSEIECLDAAPGLKALILRARSAWDAGREGRA